MSITRSFAVEQVSSIETSVTALEQAMPAKDWKAMQHNAEKASAALESLAKARAVIPALTNWSPSPRTAEELRAKVRAAEEDLRKAQEAIRDRDLERMRVTLRGFRKTYDPVREMATRPLKR